MQRPAALPWTESDDANRLLANDDLALLLGMLLDQQFRMEQAFLGPYLLKERLGGRLDAQAIAAQEWSALTEIFAQDPVIHRYPGMMAGRAQKLCQALIDEYDGDTARLWDTAADGIELLKRLKALPGYAEEKSRIFIAILGRHMGVQPPGWEAVAADWPCVADAFSFEDIARIRLEKKAMKAASGQKPARRRPAKAVSAA